MTHHLRIVAAVAVLTALALCVPVQAQTPEIDALRVRAEAGDADAQFNLGASYDDGRGVPQDAAEAVRWFRLAADQGDAVAQNLLGTMYRNGEDVPQDDVLAHMWYSLSASRATRGLLERTVQGRDACASLMPPPTHRSPTPCPRVGRRAPA